MVNTVKGVLLAALLPSAAFAAHEGVLLSALVLEVPVQIVVPVIRSLNR